MKLLLPIAVVAVVAFIVVNNAVYTIPETEQVIITQLGNPIGEPITGAGLYFKMPFAQKVNRFEKRWLEWDADPGEMPTREKNPIWVDTYARWRIAEPLKFFTATSGGDERVAQSRLDGILDSETRNTIAAHDLIEVIRSTNRQFELSAEVAEMAGLVEARAEMKIEVGREKLTQMILEKAKVKALETLGIELVDVQFQRVNYTDSVRKKVFERMISERKRIAERYRSEGEGSRAEILGKKEFKLKEIESDAYREVQQIKGKADAQATAIYAAAHNLDPSLYRLLKSLESYKKSIDKNTWIILSTDSDYFKPMMQINAR
ncbi:MAG: protease modulator HflC [Myxococcota bacterium]